MNSPIQKNKKISMEQRLSCLAQCKYGTRQERVSLDYYLSAHPPGLDSYECSET
jgi:hypothetical protein